MSHDDFAFEPIKGLPEELPEGEHILWQGAPDWWSLAKRAFFVRATIVYFAALAIWRISDALNAGAGFASGLLDAAALLPVAASALIVLCLLAYAYANSTVYTVTNRRLVVRYGVALPMTINLPFNKIGSAAVRVHRDGTGDIPLALGPDDNIAFASLWPNARPWHFTKAQPMLRAIEHPAAVAKVFTDALVADTAQADTRPNANTGTDLSQAAFDRPRKEQAQPRSAPAHDDMPNVIAAE
ncbi:MAG: photosynthetic complex putative assembly protein PuhB [Pseudomonadota bacterium]